MFRDTREELERLESALLEEEAAPEEFWDESEEPEDGLLDESFLPEDLDWDDTRVYAEPLVYDNYANRRQGEIPRVYNADPEDVDALSRQLLEDRPQGRITGLVFCAALLSFGILCAALWWIVRFRGGFL